VARTAPTEETHCCRFFSFGSSAAIAEKKNNLQPARISNLRQGQVAELVSPLISLSRGVEEESSVPRVGKDSAGLSPSESPCSSFVGQPIEEDS